MITSIGGLTGLVRATTRINIVKAKQLLGLGNDRSQILEYIMKWIIVLRGDDVFILATVFMRQQNVLSIWS